MDFIFPRTCLGCGASGKYLCSQCIQKIKKAPEICSYCGSYSFRGATHQSCKRPLGLDGAFSAWNYEGVMRKAILALKYKFASEIAKELAAILANELRKRPLQLTKAVLVPIPLHRQRKLWRGFNQTEEIGKLVAEKMGWKFEKNLILRQVDTLPQVQLKKEKRKSNVRGAFSLNPTHQSPVLFDDVWTTGPTLKEAAKVLKTCFRRLEKGTGKVWSLTLTR